MTNERRGSEASDQSDDGITYAEVVRRLNQSENNCDGRTTAFRNILHPKMSPGGLLGFVSQQRSPCNSVTLKYESPCILVIIRDGVIVIVTKIKADVS